MTCIRGKHILEYETRCKPLDHDIRYYWVVRVLLQQLLLIVKLNTRHYCICLHFFDQEKSACLLCLNSSYGISDDVRGTHWSLIAISPQRHVIRNRAFAFTFCIIFLSSLCKYSIGCDIRHLRDQTVAGYRNFLFYNIYLMCVLVYLAT